jgi:hypothetical protein
MKLYAVIDFIEYEGYSEPIAIFSSREKAQNYINFLTSDDKSLFIDLGIHEYTLDPLDPLDLPKK